MIVKATLRKKSTDDGLIVFLDKVDVGKVYRVELDTIVRHQKMEHICAPHCRHPRLASRTHYKDIIYTPEGLWLPLECLTLEGDVT